LSSKTSVTTNSSATAVNAAISVGVRSLIELAAARWEGEGKPIFASPAAPEIGADSDSGSGWENRLARDRPRPAGAPLVAR